MEPEGATTKDQILSAAYDLFYRKGFHRVSVDAIAAQAGLTKRSVYYHFPSKDDVMAAVLDVQHRHMMAQFEKWLTPPPETLPDLITQLFRELEDWTRTPEWLGSGFSRITAELADMKGHPARKVAQSHKGLVESRLSEAIEAYGMAKPENLATKIMVLIEGSIGLALIHQDTRYIRAAGQAALALIPPHPGDPTPD